jgi:hypothetical protein
MGGLPNQARPHLTCCLKVDPATLDEVLRKP